MPMLIMAMGTFTNKPGLQHADLDSKEPVTDAVSQLTTLSANVKLKPNHTTDTHTFSHMPFPLDLSQLLLDQLVLLDMEPEPHMSPEAHKVFVARDPLNHTLVMDSTDTAHSVMAHELRTPIEGIDQRNLKI